MHGAHVLRRGRAAHRAAAQGQGGHQAGGAADAAQRAGGVHQNPGGGHPAGEVVLDLLVLGVHGEGMARPLVVEDLAHLVTHVLVVLAHVEGQDGTQLEPIGFREFNRLHLEQSESAASLE